MKTRLLRDLLLVGACCACRVAAGGDPPPAGDNGLPVADKGKREIPETGTEVGGAPADTDTVACDLGVSGTLLKWQQVSAERGDGESSGVEIALDNDALAALAQIRGNIAVVSISGPYRTGKSYFLNYLANQVLARGFDPPKEPGSFRFERAFASSPGIDSSGGGGAECFFQLLPACANPLPEEPGTALLLLDTPGLMSPRRPAVQEAQVLALLEAVSSVVLYNVRSTVQRPDVTSLSMAVDAVASLEALSASMLLSVEEGGGEGADPSTPTAEEGGEGFINRPSLIWLLQQSSLKMVDDKGEPQSAAAYVDAVLGDWGEGTVKDVLDRFFVETDAAQLPFPVNEFGLLQELDTVPFSELSEAYKADVSKAVDIIVPACAPKEIGGRAVDGPTLTTFLRKLIRVMKMPVVGKGDDRPSAFLEGLEEKEVEASSAACKADWEEFLDQALPFTADEMSAKHNDCVERAMQAANPRSAVEGVKKDGEQETNETTGSERPVLNRRRGFVETLTVSLEGLYKEYCISNAWLWSHFEISQAEMELKDLIVTPASGQPGDNGDGGGEEGTDSVDGGGAGEDPSPVLPEYEDITAVYNRRWTRWIEEIVPDIARSHSDVADMVYLSATNEEGQKQDGQLTGSHMAALVSTVGTFLDDNRDAARTQARAAFDDRLEELKGDLEMLDPSGPLEDVETLSSRAKTAALEAYQFVKLAVGDDRANEVAAEEGWDKEAASAGDEWVRTAQAAAAAGGGGGGTGEGKKTPSDATGGDAPAPPPAKGREGSGDVQDGGTDNGNNNNNKSEVQGGEGAAPVPVDPDAPAEAEKAEAVAAAAAAQLAQSILDKHHAPCLHKIGAFDKKGQKAMAKCATAVMSQWELEESAKPEDLEGRKSAVLEPAMEKREAAHVEWAIQEAFRKATDRFKKEEPDLELPTADENIERLIGDARRQIVNITKLEGGLLADKESQRKLERMVHQLFEEFKSKNNGEWKNACTAAGEAYSLKVTRATSFFSLAPLRFSGAPPFEPKRCLITGATAEKMARQHDWLRAGYLRGTWGRRWLVRLALWAGFVLTMTASALLAAGRQLQHRPMAMAFLAAAAFHLVVLLLSVSEGLALGTRPWLLASSAVLGYVASGATVGGKRGRRGLSARRPIWSGRRVMNGGGGGGGYSSGSSSLMPLFRGHGGGGNGNGKGGGKSASGSWGGRHKE